VATWTAPSTSRAVNAPGNASVTNPVQAWATLVENIFTMQRKTWANMATAPVRGALTTADRPRYRRHLGYRPQQVAGGRSPHGGRPSACAVPAAGAG